jgi:hypothetical protein
VQLSWLNTHCTYSVVLHNSKSWPLNLWWPLSFIVLYPPSQSDKLQ